MCCSQSAGAELKEFQWAPWLKGSQGLALGHLSDHDIRKVSLGWFRPCLCLSGCAFHVFHNQELKARVPRSCLSSLIQTAVVALTPFSIFYYKPTFFSFQWGHRRPWMKPQRRTNSTQSKGVPQGSLSVESLHYNQLSTIFPWGITGPYLQHLSK